MEISKDRVEATLRETWATVRGGLEQGTSAVRDSIGRLPYLASLSASLQHDEVDRDETHYFLIPTPFSNTGWALYTIRRLPEGVGGDNDLPRLRVLHLAREDDALTLIDLVLETERRAAAVPFDEARSDERGEPDDVAREDRSIADRLQDVADEIDRQERKITGGILLIGGLVTVANPVVGVGILTQALIPSIGALALREGLELAGDKLRGWTRARDRKKEEREREARAEEARKRFRSTPVTTVINPVLTDLLRALRTDHASFDPDLEVDLTAIRIDGWNRDELVRLSARAIVETYGDATAGSRAAGLTFGPEDRRWLDQLRALAERPGEPSPAEPT